MELSGVKITIPEIGDKQCRVDSGPKSDGTYTVVIDQNTGGTTGKIDYIFGCTDNGDGTLTAPSDWQTRTGSSPPPSVAAST